MQRGKRQSSVEPTWLYHWTDALRAPGLLAWIFVRARAGLWASGKQRKWARRQSCTSLSAGIGGCSAIESARVLHDASAL
jgi:hypothetical protein